MKKILNIFANITLVASSSAGVISCSSTQKISTDQSLYNHLQGKTFTIQDNKFWGNEANYQQDLLKDIEKIANIPSQDDKLLSADTIKPFSQPSERDDIPILIDNSLTAHINVIWKLTLEQSPLYDFYQAWPKISQKIGDEDDRSHISLDNDYNKGPLDWWGEKSSSQEKDLIKNGWDMSQVTKYSSLNLNGSILKQMLAKKIELLSESKYANLINKYLVVPDLPMNLGQNKQLKLNDLMFKNGQASFPLNYVEQNQNGKTTLKPWTIDYSNDYYLIQNRLAQIGTVHILKDECQADKDGKYYAQNNISVINDELDNLGYSDIITDHLNFSSPKPLQLDKSTSVEVYYKGIYQDFKIAILMG